MYILPSGRKPTEVASKGKLSSVAEHVIVQTLPVGVSQATGLTDVRLRFAEKS
jgi:hypothetical protein